MLSNPFQFAVVAAENCIALSCKSCTENPDCGWCVAASKNEKYGIVVLSHLALMRAPFLSSSHRFPRTHVPIPNMPINALHVCSVIALVTELTNYYCYCCCSSTCRELSWFSTPVHNNTPASSCESWCSGKGCDHVCDCERARVLIQQVWMWECEWVSKSECECMVVCCSVGIIWIL